MPKPLLTIAYTTGSFHSAAMLSDSWNAPMLVVAITHLADDHVVLFGQFDGQPSAGCDGQLAADDRIAAQQTFVPVEQVHGAAATARDAAVSRPNSSAMTRSGSMPRARA